MEIWSKMVMIKKDTKIICPNEECKVHIATFAVDIKEGDMINTASVQGASQAIEIGDLFNCKACGTQYYTQEKGFHVETGWTLEPMPGLDNAAN